MNLSFTDAKLRQGRSRKISQMDTNFRRFKMLALRSKASDAPLKLTPMIQRHF